MVEGGREKKKVEGFFDLRGRKDGRWEEVLLSSGPDDRRWGVLRSSDQEDRRTASHRRRTPHSKK